MPLRHTGPVRDLLTTVTWRGERVRTLAPLWPDRPRAVVVARNPVPCDVEEGRYLRGPLGRRQVGRLVAAGLLPAPAADEPWEEAALAAGVGVLHLVPRPASGPHGVTAEELAEGGRTALGEIAARAVPLVVCVSRPAVAALLGRAEAPGPQSRTLAGGTRVFRMPSPFDPAAEVARTMATLDA